MKEKSGPLMHLWMHRSANRARKLVKKTVHYKPIPPPHPLSASHLPFLHERFLHEIRSSPLSV